MHAASERHNKCLDAKAVKESPRTTPLNVAISRLTHQQNETMMKLFRTAYCIAKQHFSIRSFPTLLSLQEQNGLNLGRAYRNRMAASSFILSISGVMQAGITDCLNSVEFFSLLLDGSTDISTTEQEIVYVRFLKDGKPFNIFLGLMSITDASANGLALHLDTFLTNLGIQNWKSKLVGLGTDGATVNVGQQGGLGAIFKRELPYLVQIHCVAHRLELAVLDACKKIEYVEKFHTIHG